MTTMYPRAFAPSGRKLAAALSLFLLLLPPSAIAEEAQLLPALRQSILLDHDLPGGDIGQMFDTTSSACERACLTEPSCTAYTFNRRSNSCFIKKNPDAATPYNGATSTLITRQSTADQSAAQRRSSALSFLSPADFQAAKRQAEAIPRRSPSNGRDLEELLQDTQEQAYSTAPRAALQPMGAAVSLSDHSAHWLLYSALWQAEAQSLPDYQQQEPLNEAISAALNAYLRSDDPDLQHASLRELAASLLAIGRGRDQLKTLQLAQSLRNDPETRQLLDEAIAQYGFRVIEHHVESELAQPRLCMRFSEAIAASPHDLSDFLQTDKRDVTLERNGENELCLSGYSHGEHLRLTLRSGLPAADGQATQRPVTIEAYIRDRSPQVRFSGRKYVLARGAAPLLPIETVNTDRVALTLYRVSDRNLLRAVQSGYLNEPIPYYHEEDFAEKMAQEIWRGEADVALELNRDRSTALPLDEALKGQSSGVFALKATLPGKQGEDFAPTWQWFVISDLGMTSLSGQDGLHVVLRSFESAGPKAGVTVQLLSQANALLGEAISDAEGRAFFPAALTRGRAGAAPALITAAIEQEGAQDFAFLSLSEPEFDLSDRGVEGRALAGPIDVFMTTERGAYRAGETVYLTALARDANAKALKGLPLTAVLKRPDGVEYSRHSPKSAEMGGHVFAMPIAASAPRGRWRVEIFADLDAPALANRSLLVEDFLPERLDFSLDLAEDSIPLSASPTLSLRAHYLFGAPAADLAIEGELQLRPLETLAGWSGYRFGRYDRPFNPVMQPISEQRSDAEGAALIALSLPQLEQPPNQPLELQAVVRISEGSGRPVERIITRPVLAQGPMIGIRPLFDEAAPEGGMAEFELRVLGPDGQPSAMALEWTLTRVETRYQWYQEYGDWMWEPVTSRRRAAEGQIDTQAGATAAPARLALPVEWGQYELELRERGGTATSAILFDAGWYAPAGVSQSPDRLELSLDQPRYRAGDQAELRLLPPAAGVVLVSVMSDRLITMQAVEVTAGEHVMRLPVTEDWGTGAYVSATYLRPNEATTSSRTPIRALGLTHASVAPATDAPARELQITLTAPPEQAPRARLPVEIAVEGLAKGSRGFVTLAAVDQGILNLTAFKPPTPSEYYFGQRRLGVGIRDLYGRLIDPSAASIGQLRSGGDAGADARLLSPPPTEELAAFFVGPLALDENGRTSAQFDLPSFNGSLRLMAMAWSEEAVGEAHQDVLVRDPVVVNASLPRFMAPGDHSQLRLELTHVSGASGPMQLALEQISPELQLSALPPAITLAAGESQVLELPLSALAAGPAQLVLALTTPEGRVLRKNLAVPVVANDPAMAELRRITLAPQEGLTLDRALFADLQAGTGSLTLASGTLGRLDALGLMAALERYAYTCTEQLTSRALPLLYHERLAMVLGGPDTPPLGLRLSEAITDILARQGSEGGFGLWRAGGGDFWLDAYVTDFLSRARAAGQPVPDRAFNAALANLSTQVSYSADFNEGGEALAYALMVLAREGSARMGDLRYFADVKAESFSTPTALAQLGAALASYGDQQRADRLLAMAGQAALAEAANPQARFMRVDYGSTGRDLAAVLTLASEARSQAVDREALTLAFSATTLTEGPSALSPQEMAWGLMAAKALEAEEAQSGLSLDGVALKGALLQRMSADMLSGQLLVNEGSAPITLTMTRFGQPIVPPPAQRAGYSLTRRYYDLEGKPIDLSQPVVAGTRMVAVLEITPLREHGARLAITDPLPAGFEIDNPRLLRAGQISALDWLNLNETEHSEFRSDRFMAALNHGGSSPIQLAYLLRAISPGEFHHPSALVEDMDRPSERATTDAGRVIITAR